MYTTFTMLLSPDIAAAETKLPTPLLDIRASWSLVREGDGARMSGLTDRRESFDRSVEWSDLETSAEHAVHRYPPLREARFKRKLNVSVQLQPELIGGIRVVVGDEVLDTSVKARLEQMKAALTA